MAYVRGLRHLPPKKGHGPLALSTVISRPSARHPLAHARCCLLALGGLTSCGLDYPCGGNEASYSPREATSTGVFLSTLVLNKADFVLPNGTPVSIKHAWLEKGWSRNCQTREEVLTGTNQIIICFRDSSSLMTSYGIGADKEGVFGSNGDHSQILVSKRAAASGYKNFVFQIDEHASRRPQVVDSLFLTPVRY